MRLSGRRGIGTQAKETSLEYTQPATSDKTRGSR